MKTINRIVNAIKKDTFDFEEVMQRGEYLGNKVNVTPLLCSYGQIGYCVNFVDEDEQEEIQCDYEFKEMQIIKNGKTIKTIQL